METTELNVNRLTATFSSNFGARYEQATATYKCNQGHLWLEDDLQIKTPVEPMPIRCTHQMQQVTMLQHATGT